MKRGRNTVERWEREREESIMRGKGGRNKHRMGVRKKGRQEKK